MDKARVKLVTIIASAELEDRLEKDLHELGASGYTICRVNGCGKHGVQKRGIFEIGNVRVEAVVSETVAEALLDRVARAAKWGAIVAFAQDVDAVPREHFLSQAHEASR